MRIKNNDLIIEVKDVSCDGEKIYAYAPKYKKLIVIKYATAYDTYNVYQKIMKDTYYDVTGHISAILDKGEQQ